MSNKNSLSTIILALSCIRVITFFISFIGVSFQSSGIIHDFLSALHYLNTAIHISVMLFIAYGLSLIKEETGRSIAFVLLAFMSVLFMALELTKTLNRNVLSILGMVNIIVIVFFVVQSFLIKNLHFKNAFRIYSVVVILMVAVNALIPVIFYRMALPVASYKYASMLGIFPAAIECYLVYLFYQYFNSAPVYHDNDFYSKL